MMPADFMVRLRAFVGLALTDTTHDEWLELQAEVVVSAMRAATGRWLFPARDFTDTFATPTDPCNPCAPACGCACPPVMLAEMPIGALVSIHRDAQALDVAQHQVDQLGTVIDTATGRALTVPASGQVVVAYRGGFDTLPAQLLQAVLDLVGAAWAASGRSVSGGLVLPQGVSRVQIQDVGTIEFAGLSGAGAADPILGRYAALLGPYTRVDAGFGGHPCRSSVAQAQRPPRKPALVRA